MKYYVRKDASSEIEGPFDLDVIRGWIAGGRFTAEYEALEDHEQSLDQMKESERWMPLEDVFALHSATTFEQAPKAFLKAVRKRSCYKGFRFCADLLAVAGWAGCVWWVFPLHSIEVPVNQWIGVALVIIGVAVFRLTLRLLTDVGDLLIEQNRRR